MELFAGVGGFRLGLERSGWRTVWANQWEPSTRVQHAADCYNASTGPTRPWSTRTSRPSSRRCPAHDLLVGGFPCQDYSVAKTASQARGLEGIKGVLWWSIYDILERRRPKHVFLENVDRLLKSPTSHRGRDFAIILSCLNGLGYMVEWRVVNAAEYGFPQRRKRVFIVATKLPARTAVTRPPRSLTGSARASTTGVACRGPGSALDVPDLVLAAPEEITSRWPSRATHPFRESGVMWKARSGPGRLPQLRRQVPQPR